MRLFFSLRVCGSSRLAGLNELTFFVVLALAPPLPPSPSLPPASPARSFIPPLNISKEDMAKGCDIIRNAITEVVKEG